MDRETIKDCYRVLAKVYNGIRGLPYRDAVPVIEALGELRGIIEEELPGGFVGFCELCEVVIAGDDNSATDDGGCHICRSCCDEANRGETSHG